VQNSGKPKNSDFWLALLCNLQKRVVDLRFVFNETSIMGVHMMDYYEWVKLSSSIDTKVKNCDFSYILA
jgi:hypothetical protein